MNYLLTAILFVGGVFAAGYSLHQITEGFVFEEWPMIIRGAIAAVLIVTFALWFADMATQTGAIQ